MPGDLQRREDGAVKKAIVVGTGAGGATAARELASHFDVTVLEAGREFRPFGPSLSLPERLKRAGLLFDERLIRILFPAMDIRKAGEMILVRALATGGTTTIAAGNALRMGGDFERLGLDLAADFDAVERDVPISAAHEKRWNPATRAAFDAFRELGLAPRPMPKMIDFSKCRACGRCILGCPYGAKWDTRRFLADAVARGAKLRTGTRVESVIVEKGRASGVVFRRGLRRGILKAELVVLAAGGFGTPPILSRTGIPLESRLFVDPVLCVAAPLPGAAQDREILMPFASQLDGYILSPYFDPLSYYFNRAWRPKPRDIFSVMIKLADSEEGSAAERKVSKALTARDRARLDEAVALARSVLLRLGVREKDVFLGTLNAGHPGGMLPLGSEDVASLHPARLPEGLYIADASLFPASLGNPPILTIMALARRISRAVAERFA